MIKKRRRPEDPGAPMELSMTSMIDVVFQLLIFFLCSIHFKDVEAKLTTVLPKSGPAITDYAKPNPNEIRIRLVNDPGRSTTVSAGLLTAHERIGTLQRTTPDTTSTAGTVNRNVYAVLQDRLRILHQEALRDPTYPPRVIIDAAEDIPYEHVIGAMNACKEANVLNIEFTANPEHMRLFQR